MTMNSPKESLKSLKIVHVEVRRAKNQLKKRNSVEVHLSLVVLLVCMCVMVLHVLCGFCVCLCYLSQVVVYNVIKLCVV